MKKTTYAIIWFLASIFTYLILDGEPHGWGRIFIAIFGGLVCIFCVRIWDGPMRKDNKE